MIDYCGRGAMPLTELEEGNGGADGVSIYRLDRTGTYSWSEELKGAYSTWSALCGRDHSLRQWFAPNAAEAMYQFGSPVLGIATPEGKNLVTAALSDSVKRTRLTVSVDDLNQRDEIIFTATLFDDGAWQQEDREVLLRIDRRNVDHCEAMEDAGEWMRSFIVNARARIPRGATEPLCSSWYNFHQEPEQELLSRELEAAAELGFKTVIVDDGWQFEGNNTGDYFKCGDWAVARDKFPDFAAFSRKVHALGMKLMLWFPVPFAGYATGDYKRFKDKMAFDIDAMRAGVLDVRYPEIREYIVGIYKRFVRDYDIDGLKLDFVDAFRNDPAAVAPYKEGMDNESLDRAVRILMDEIYNEMTANKPDFLFEFRQCYVGAEIVNHCNMLRVGDCAADSVQNRISIATMRLLNKGTAIHSDMLLWGRNETPENCMRQMLNVLFSVPQISVLLTKIPETQLLAVKRFVSYWTENRDVLLNGKIRVSPPETEAAVISAASDSKKITVLNSNGMFRPWGGREDVFNNTSEGVIVSAGGGRHKYFIYNWAGELLEEGVTGEGAERFSVPAAGLLSLIPLTPET